jgi:hypothetical protein
MMRAGYRPAFAAGVEATASMGGQLIPPVMGAAAFIMAETLGVSYGTVALAAAIPGVLYFVAVGVMVHFEAARQGLPVLPRAELPRLGPVLKRDFHLLAGPASSSGSSSRRSPLFVGFWALTPRSPRAGRRGTASVSAGGRRLVEARGVFAGRPRLRHRRRRRRRRVGDGLRAQVASGSSASRRGACC